MSGARYIVGPALDVLRSLPDASVDCLITSPPYHRQRAYLPDDHPDKPLELGQEATPGEYLENLLVLMDEMWRVLVDWGTFWVNLGDTHAGSGGSGGDYLDGGLREGQAKWMGTGRVGRTLLADGRVSHTPWRGQKPGHPRDQSVEWAPHLFGASLAYGRNLLTGAEHRCWVTRPPVTWCKPSVSPGALERRFRTATELVVYGGKNQRHFFDLDAVRTPSSDYHRGPGVARATPPGQKPRTIADTTNPAGAPPFNWWVVGHGSGFPGAHFATFPPELIVRPVMAGCPAKVCLACGRPVARVVESSYVGEPDDSTRRKEHGRLNGRDNPPERGWERERKTVGWSCGCPANGATTRPGLVFDPFGGTGVTAMVATGHGRDCLLVDLDERNADLARQRVGMFLSVEHHAPESTPA